MSSHIPEWAWIFVVSSLVFALTYTWARRVPVRAAAAQKAGGPSPSSPPPVSPPPPRREPSEPLPRMDFEEEDDVDPTRVGAAASTKLPPLQPPAKKIIYDEDAAIEEPTGTGALIVVWGMAQTDRGLRRKRNEDSILAMPEHGLYVVADGMGGYRGGEIASALAAKSIEGAFRRQVFDGWQHEELPRRASELARAMQMANTAIRTRAESQRELSGMGTTLCAARFSADKQRLYVGHVGDSRMYRLRERGLEQLTSDHTMRDFGVTGAGASHLSRALGVWPTVPMDVVFCRPRPRDLYLLCSDGLTKMVSDAEIGEILGRDATPAQIVEMLVSTANAHGGKDNISVIVLRVDSVASA